MGKSADVLKEIESGILKYKIGDEMENEISLSLMLGDNEYSVNDMYENNEFGMQMFKLIDALKKFKPKGWKITIPCHESNENALERLDAQVFTVDISPFDEDRRGLSTYLDYTGDTMLQIFIDSKYQKQFHYRNYYFNDSE